MFFLKDPRKQVTKKHPNTYWGRKNLGEFSGISVFFSFGAWFLFFTVDGTGTIHLWQPETFHQLGHLPPIVPVTCEPGICIFIHTYTLHSIHTIYPYPMYIYKHIHRCFFLHQNYLKVSLNKLPWHFSKPAWHRSQRTWWDGPSCQTSIETSQALRSRSRSRGTQETMTKFGLLIFPLTCAFSGGDSK